MCGNCGIELHVCRMCVHFDAGVARQCREDDAEDVHEKERANFCEWFEPSPEAGRGQSGSSQGAANELAALFGDAESTSESGADVSADDDPWARIQSLAGNRENGDSED
jgi:hypothetical protein